MNSVFNYVNYRRFLKDYYQQAKAEKKYFSYRYFSRRAGINSPNFLKVVIEGKRNLSSKTIDKFANALGLNRNEAMFFRRLVVFNQAKTASEKQESYIILREIANQMRQNSKSADSHESFEKWYTNVVRELIADAPQSHENQPEDTGNGGELICTKNTRRAMPRTQGQPQRPVGSFNATGLLTLWPQVETTPEHLACVQMFKFQGQPAFTATANGNATVKQFIL
jgi:hypothetical protein